MMGRDHALSGALAGLGAAETWPLLSGHQLSPATLLLATLVIAGAAFLPDLDHPSATIARTWGPVSGTLASGLNNLGIIVWRATRGPRERPIKDGHRTFSHTIVFAMVAGALFGLIAGLGGRWAVVVLLYILLTLAFTGLRARRLLRALARGAPGPRSRAFLRELARLNEHVLGAAVALAFIPAAPTISPAALGAAVAFGCWVHCLGDSCTLYGCPWLWPIPIAGQHWYRIGTPRWMRFRTGTEEFDGEDRLRIAMWFGVTALAINLVPGSWALIGDGAAWAWTTVT